jgi:RNA polymerase sigma-70 factor, ECF subfamily
MSAVDSRSPDGLLIAAALTGEPEAFAHLASRYQGALFKAAISRLGRRELAEDAVQETFLCAHRWLHTYDSQFSFRTWLWTILLNQCSRLAKREAKHAPRDLDAAPVAERQSAFSLNQPCAQSSPLERLLTRETSERLTELLAKLPEPQADALRLRFFGELTFPEIAAAMGCSEPGAKHRVKAGLIKLSEWLTEQSREKTTTKL